MRIDRISFVDDVDTPEAAIISCGKLMLEAGLIKPSYIPAMIDVYHQLGAYMVIAPHVALPHASPQSGALKSGICLCVLRNPVIFGHSDNDPVHLLFGLASHDGNSHIQNLAEVADFLGYDQNITNIISSKTIAEIEYIFMSKKGEL